MFDGWPSPALGRAARLLLLVRGTGMRSLGRGKYAIDRLSLHAELESKRENPLGNFQMVARIEVG